MPDKKVSKTPTRSATSTKSITSKTSVSEDAGRQLAWLENRRDRLTVRYHAELARFSTWLSCSVIVAIAFLLLGGLHSPKTLLLVSMYTALGAFALSVLAYLVVTLLTARVVSRTLAREAAAATDTAAADKAVKDAQGQLQAAAVLQQVLFVLGVVAVVVFAIEISLLFFPAATAPATSAQPTAS